MVAPSKLTPSPSYPLPRRAPISGRGAGPWGPLPSMDPSTRSAVSHPFLAVTDISASRQRRDTGAQCSQTDPYHWSSRLTADRPNPSPSTNPLTSSSCGGSPSYPEVSLAHGRWGARRPAPGRLPMAASPSAAARLKPLYVDSTLWKAAISFFILGKAKLVCTQRHHLSVVVSTASASSNHSRLLGSAMPAVKKDQLEVCVCVCACVCVCVRDELA